MDDYERLRMWENTRRDSLISAVAFAYMALGSLLLALFDTAPLPVANRWWLTGLAVACALLILGSMVLRRAAIRRVRILRHRHRI